MGRRRSKLDRRIIFLSFSASSLYVACKILVVWNTTANGFQILHAFDNGEDTFLSSPEWTTIPFSIHPKTKFDELIDIFTLGPELSSMGKSLATLPMEQVFPTSLSILGKLAIIRQKLQTFYSDLEDTYPKPLYWERVSPTRDDLVSSDAEFVFPPALWFHDLDTASILTLYWAILTMVRPSKT